MAWGALKNWLRLALLAVTVGLTGCLQSTAPTPTPSLTPRPTATLIPSQTPTAEFVPDALGFRGTHKWLSDEGVYHLMGEVVNQGAYPLQGITVTVRLADSLGQTVAEGYDELDVPLLMPGRMAPFNVVLYGERVTAAWNFQVQASGEGVNPDASGITDRVEVVAAAQFQADGALRFDGEVTNTSAHVLERVVVAITLFNVEAQVVGAGTATVNGPLAAGETATFTRVFLPSDLADETAGYTLLAEGWVAGREPIPQGVEHSTPDAQ